MLLPVHPQVSNALKQVFEMIKIDDVSMLLKLDMVIIKYANSLNVENIITMMIRLTLSATS